MVNPGTSRLTYGMVVTNFSFLELFSFGKNSNITQAKAIGITVVHHLFHLSLSIEAYEQRLDSEMQELFLTEDDDI